MRNTETIGAVLERYEKCRNPLKEYYLRQYLRARPDQLIIDQVGMAEMPKIIYLLRKKYHKRLRLIPEEDDLNLCVGKRNVGKMSFLAVYIHFLKIAENEIHIEGNMSVPAGLRKHEFYVRVNGEKMGVGLTDCGLDLRLNGEIYEKRTVFRAILPLTGERCEIEFYNRVRGVECRCARINAMRFSPAADCIKGQYCCFGEWVVRILGNKVVCQRAGLEEQERYEEDYQREIALLAGEDGHWAAGLRKRYFEERKRRRKPVWLIMDRCDRADDNGEIFFRYMQRHGEIDTYFVIDGQCEDFGRLQAVGKVIPLYSEEHFLLVLSAECIISSQCNGYVENPFWEKAEYFRDLYHRPKLIFLQHGVIKDDMSPTLNRFHTNFAGFVTSTQAEYQSILNGPYSYDEENIWLTGLPVLDELQNREQGYIVLAPTWRMGLMRQAWDEEKRTMVWVPGEDIKSSEYYGVYRRLFMNAELRDCCRKYGYRLAFKPHPLMEAYLKEITEGTDVLWMGAEVSYRDMLGMGNLLVTDYSSVAFEFAYLGKSTVYFQFDRKSFFSSHTYRKGYFDYVRDGFGEVCCKEKELTDLLAGYMRNGCAVKKKYEERIRKLYPYRGGACGRIFDKIKERVQGEDE